jgi:regulator of sigma E protease
VSFSILFASGGGAPTSEIDRVVEGSPAAAIGLRSGDRILAIGDRRVAPERISTAINASRGAPVTIQVERAGRTIELGPQRPERVEGRYRLGFVLTGEPLSPPAATKEAVNVTWIVTKEIGGSLKNLVHEEGREQISSPVGIVEGSSSAARQGSQTYLWVLGLISLSLALLNLLPLLPLDGGHIFFSLLEWMRGRAVPREVYERFSAIGIALVLMLFFIGLTNDVGRLGD